MIGVCTHRRLMVYYKAREARADDVHASAVFIPPCLLTGLGCIFIIATFRLFKDLRKLRNVRLLYYMAWPYFVGNLGAILGPVPTGSPACWFQGITGTVCFSVAAAWAAVFAMEFGLVVHYGLYTTKKQRRRIHQFIWTVIPLCSLPPLATMTFGNNPSLSEYSWAFLTDVPDDDGPNTSSPDSRANVARNNLTNTEKGTGLFFDFLSSYLWIYGAVAVSIVVCLSVLVRTSTHHESFGKVRRALLKMMTYPLIIALGWLPGVFYDSDVELNPSKSFPPSSQWFILFVQLIHPFFLALSFWSFSPTVQQHWKMLVSNTVTDIEARATSIHVTGFFSSFCPASIVSEEEEYEEAGTGDTHFDGQVRVNMDSFEAFAIHHRTTLNPSTFEISASTKRQSTVTQLAQIYDHDGDSEVFTQDHIPSLEVTSPMQQEVASSNSEP